MTTIYPAATATQRLPRIRAAFDRPYEPARCIQPESLAAMITWVLAEYSRADDRQNLASAP